jgi:hypothetical protein
VSLFAAIKSHLLHHSKISLLVDDRVYHMVARRNPVRPYIVFQIISQDRWRHMTAVCGVVDTDVQLNCYADTADDADELAEAIRDSLDHFNHDDIGRAPDTIEVRAAFLNNSFMDTAPDPDGREYGLSRAVQEWRILHTESLPALAV